MSNPVAATRVMFSTRDYEMNHGAKPRGDGQWGFIAYDYRNAADYLSRVKWFSGPFGEAKRAAASAFAAEGVSDVSMCS